MSNVIRFERATVQFTEGLSVDGYMTPNGEFRVGVMGSALVLGFSQQWLFQLLSRGGKTLKALQGMGFTTSQLEGSVDRDGRGASGVATISLKDFAILIAYATSQGKPQALALQLSLTELSLMDFFRDAFGQRPLTMAEKRERFYRAYAASLDWAKEDRLDVEALWLMGDPPELLGWNEG